LIPQISDGLHRLGASTLSNLPPAGPSFHQIRLRDLGEEQILPAPQRLRIINLIEEDRAVRRHSRGVIRLHRRWQRKRHGAGRLARVGNRLGNRAGN
jgi:hypothetical protein